MPWHGDYSAEAGDFVKALEHSEKAQISVEKDGKSDGKTQVPELGFLSPQVRNGWYLRHWWIWVTKGFDGWMNWLLCELMDLRWFKSRFSPLQLQMDSPKTQRDHEIWREAYKLDPRSTEAGYDGLSHPRHHVSFISNIKVNMFTQKNKAWHFFVVPVFNIVHELFCPSILYAQYGRCFTIVTIGLPYL
jgi:hypothetical protein